MHAAFQTPPRAGLLFNLDTGQVLWQQQPLHPPAHRQPDEDDDRAADGRILAAGRARARDQGRRSSQPGSKVGVLPRGQARAPGEHALRSAAALRQRRRRRARPARGSAACNRFVMRMNAEAAQAGDGLHALFLAVGLLRPVQLHLRRRPGCARPRRSAAVAHRVDHAHLHRRAAVPDQGRAAVPVQQQPAADLRLSRADRPEDRLHASRRTLPGGDRRA